MAKVRKLDGNEICDFMMEAQARKIRGLKQHFKVSPKLVFLTSANESLFGNLLANYCQQIELPMKSIAIEGASNVAPLMNRLNSDSAITGIVVDRTLPLKISNKIVIAARKDVDGHLAESKSTPAIITALNCLLTAYGVDVGRQVVSTNSAALRQLLVQYPMSANEKIVDWESAMAAGQAQGVILMAGSQGHLEDSAAPGSRRVVVDLRGVLDGNDAWRTVGGIVDGDVGQKNVAAYAPAYGGLGPVVVAVMVENLIQASYPRL